MMKRSCPKTLEYLKSMGGVQMEFLNKVGDNSRPNGFALAFGTPKLAQVWPTTLAHETLKDLYHSDEQFLAFFKKNREFIDQSFFIMMGDHGPRRDGIGETLLGKYENSNPFLVVLIPSKYRSTSIHYELYKKANELITHFDLHATLMDILKLQPDAEFSDTSYRELAPLSKGSSLFREWRGVRNCRTLPIPSAYCICQYNKTAVTDQVLIIKLGNFFAEQLNKLLHNSGLKNKCQMQYYNSTSTITQIEDGDAVIYDIAVYLKPSGGLLTAHVRSNSAGLKLSSGFSRLNRYGRQGDCLIGNPLRPLCHCIGTTAP
ncbi:unnamed protein product [Angiostrongylus costaricensis]|uniref:Sulfatase domain-containing protein n=1 Tax=Angiostrongylus costaricensis TaxID=334426 RepID=A0A0R3PX87_ANGCS|nr:unnamed protein product [Angiostrongylus costaricensis]